MESSNHHKQQAMGSHLLLPAPQEKRRREQPETAVRCPRCNSGDTKFCYYNNYSLSQPRHFCKTCRRYWTKGGSLRNIPVGGSSRKNRRKHSPSSSSSSKKPRLHRPPPPSTGELGGFAGGGAFFVGVPSSSSDPLETPTFLDILRNRFLDSSSAGGFGDLCDGFHGGAAAPPLEGFVAGDGGEGPFVGLQSPQLGGGGGSGTAEPFGRDYWDRFGSTRHGRPVNTYFV